MQKVAELLGGKGTWVTSKARPALAPRIQKPSDNWMAAVIDCEDDHPFAAVTGEVEVPEPGSLKEAQSCPDWPLWEKAIEEELKLLREAGSWEVVDEPRDVNVVGSKWVFKAKKDASRSVI